MNAMRSQQFTAKSAGCRIISMDRIPGADVTTGTRVTDYTLYCIAQSGNWFKAALALNLCGADWRPRHVDYFNGETRTPAYRQINEMGEAPVLEFRDGHGVKRLSQSGVILDYLSAKFGRFGPEND